MLNIVMLVQDRPRLTRQALESLYANTKDAFTLTVVDDSSKPETKSILDSFFGAAKNMALLNDWDCGHVIGRMRNLGVQATLEHFGRGDYLYFSDNDAYFTPGWDTVLIDGYKHNRHERFLILGGCNHPFHAAEFFHCWVPGTRFKIREYQALAGTSHFMKWSTWDRFGPYLETGGPGVCQSEDFALCQKIREEGGRIGAIWPEVVYDCGITQTGGTLSPGATMKRRYEGVIYE